MKINKKNAPKYGWGDQCIGWHLLDTQKLSVIEEKMPPGTMEQLHLHRVAEQFFYILKGTAIFELDQQPVVLQAGDGIHVQPGKIHKIINNSNLDLHFLVISHPKSHGDRLNFPENWDQKI